MTAKELYELLIKEKITKGKGFTDFTFMGIRARITAKSTVGYVFQDWLENWLTKKGIKFGKKGNSQEWPDLYLDREVGNEKGIVEIKTFEVDEGPNFDIANFDAYHRSLKTDAYRLDADYLIFCYRLNKKGDFSIVDMWLKKVWEISSAMGSQPLKCQIKQGVIVNIRPAKWFSEHIQNPVFTSRRQFVEAIYNTLLAYQARSAESANWLTEVENNYKKNTGRGL